MLLAVLWRLRYKLSFRDVAESLLVRGYVATREPARVWELRFAPLVAQRLRARRRGRASASWYPDETYAKIAGQARSSPLPQTLLPLLRRITAP